MTGKWSRFVLGMVTGAMLFAGISAAIQAANGTLAEPSGHKIFLDGKRVYMTAYTINGNNYVKLRDVGQALNFNVYWKNGVQIESNAPYTGVEPSIDIPDQKTPGADKPVSAAASSADVDVEAIRQDIIKRTNDLRKENGLSQLTVDDLLMEAAQVRADEMAATSIYSHIRPDGTQRTTVTDCPYTSENIHCITAQRLTDPNTDLAKIAVDEWAASDIHLNGMLDAERSGIGVGIAKGVNPANGKECWYCVQWFLRTGYTITWVDDPITQK